MNDSDFADILGAAAILDGYEKHGLFVAVGQSICT
jgi:hypothetical protein